MLLALVGGYMLYTAYHLAENARNGAEDMAYPAVIAFTALFALAGLGVIVYAWIVWRKGEKERKDAEQKKDDA